SRSTCAPDARLVIDRSRKVSSPGPIQTTRLADWSARASDGRSAYAWGELPPGTSSRGSATPCITAATSEWTGAIDATTTGETRGDAWANDGHCQGRNAPSAIAAAANVRGIQRVMGIRRVVKGR